jgi:hypothetical protein
MAKEKKAPKAEATPEELRQEALRAGLYVLMILAVLTLGEYTTAVIASPWTFILWIVAAWKAFLVIKDYMHIGRLFGDEETH